MKSMTWALAGRITVIVILVVTAYGLIVLAVARFMAWVTSKYGADQLAPARELERYDFDEYEEPLPPAA